MFVITKVEACSICGWKFSGSGNDRKKLMATQMAINDVKMKLHQHLKSGSNPRCRFEFDSYEENLKEYIRPKFVNDGLRMIRNIVAYING